MTRSEIEYLDSREAAERNRRAVRENTRRGILKAWEWDRYQYIGDGKGIDRWTGEIIDPRRPKRPESDDDPIPF